MTQAMGMPMRHSSEDANATQEEPAITTTSAVSELMSEAEVEASRGALTTFQLAILTRRNATWQGAVDWMEGQSPMSFSSDLELLSLVDRHMEEL